MALSLMAFPVMSHAQDTASPVPAAEEGEAVVIVGTRASQRSSIDRKKRAKTATDSIVAEDVGKFPDRNIGEAISRIPGVALGRSDYGEGESITLRGSNSDMVNVEIDGLGVQDNSLTGGASFGGSGRNKDFRAFPADLIKSVDVVKGNTAAMTEGGIGGSILVQSRTALDFKKPFLSFRTDITANSLSNDWTPGYNLIATRKFMNDRLGILLNVSQNTIQNDNNAIQQSNGGTGLQRGWVGLGSGNVVGTAAIDLDGSPDKTFTFNPSTLSGAGIDTAFSASSETPRTLLEKSAAAQTKADCYAAFPLLTGNNSATAQRTNELITCLNQWNDYTPSLIRYFVRQNREVRQNIDLRADYRVNDDLDVFVRGIWNRRKVNDVQLTFNVGGFTFNPANSTTPTYNGVAYLDVAGVRTEVPGSGYYVYDGVSFGSSVAPNNAAASANGVLGAVTNIVPGSAVFDDSHHLISATITDGGINTDQIQNTNDYRQNMFSTGFDYHRGPISAKLLLGRAESEYTRYDYRVNPGLFYPYGPAEISMQSGSGLWSIAFPEGLDNGDASLYSITRPATASRPACTPSGNNPCVPGQTGQYSIAQQPWTSFSYGFQLSPRVQETVENSARFDLTYDFENKLPFVRNLQVGFNMREQTQQGWDGGARTISAAKGTFGTAGYVPPVVIARNSLRSTLRACDDQRYGVSGGATPAGALPCNYGYLANTDIATAHEGVFTLRPADLESLLGQVFLEPTNQFFHGYPDRGNLIEGWKRIDVNKYYQLIGEYAQRPEYSAGGDPLEFHNFNCVKTCVASDGKVYDMLSRKTVEKTTAAYWMIEFQQDLPFDMIFDGNLGTRMVKTDVEGAGWITLNSIRCNSTTNCLPSTAASATTTYTSQTPISFSAHTTDWLPSYNYNLWLRPNEIVLRYNTSKAIARPGINQLLPTGACTFDQRSEGVSGDNGCGTFGNPALKPYFALKKNWSLEWYPNRDTQFSYSVFKDDIKSGQVQNELVDGSTFLAGLGLTDPFSGQDVGSETFDYTRPVRGPGYVRRGTEVAFKTAFTFLPWYFRYTGADGNYAKIESSTTGQGVQDPNSGDLMPPVGESSYYINLSLWYDDGKTNARLAYQSRDLMFNCISSCGVNSGANYPGLSYSPVRLPYNPGAPTYTAASQYLDFKISHTVNEGLELFFQANNILKENAKQVDQGDYLRYSDGTPSIMEVGYGGYRITTGFTIRR